MAEGNSKFYFVCHPHGIQLAVCVRGTAFNPLTEKCEPLSGAKTTRRYYDPGQYKHLKIPECIEPGRFAVPMNPSYFYECVDNKDYFEQEINLCDDSKIFNIARRRCMHSNHAPVCPCFFSVCVCQKHCDLLI